MNLRLAAAICLASSSVTAAPVRIRDTLTTATGAPPEGTLAVSWARFRTAAGKTITAGSLSVPIHAGLIDLALEPNAGALPAGSVYAVHYSFSAPEPRDEDRVWTVTARGEGTLTLAEIESAPAASGAPGVKSAADFGAIGNGVADDTAALQRALDWACADHPGDLFIPQGIYNISAQLTCALHNHGNHTILGVHIYGSGTNSILRNVGSTNGALSVTGAMVANFDDFYLSNLRIRNATKSTGAFGFKMDGVAGFGITNLVVEGNGTLAEGVALTASQQGYLLGVSVRRAATGISLGHHPAHDGYDQGQDRIKIDSGMVQDCAVQAFLVDNGPNGGNVLITNFHTDQNPIGMKILSGGPLEVSNMHFESNSLAGILIALKNLRPFSASSMTIRHNQFYEPTGKALDVTGTGILIEDNYLVGPTRIDAQSTNITLANNTSFGTITNLSTVGFFSYGNRCNAESGSLCPALSSGIPSANPALACGGKAMLAAGSVRVPTTCPIGANDYVMLTRQHAVGATGDLRIGTIASGSYFGIESSSPGDESIVAWEIRRVH